MTAPLLRIENLAISFGETPAVTGVSLTIGRGETLALVGESGSGKSATALAIPRLLPYPLAHHPSGRILFDGADTLAMTPAELRALRGDRIGLIFQEPMTSLNPLHGIGRQIGETLALHRGLRGKELTDRVVELLHLVGLPQMEDRLSALPHELSGGQRQRVMIAMALANQPDLLIADEPTTALDVTIQAQILDLLRDLKARLDMAVLFITHDLRIAAEICDTVGVMQLGRIVEYGPAAEVLKTPRDPYTQSLLAAVPGRGWTIPRGLDPAEAREA